MNKEFCLFKIDQKRVIWEVTNYCNYECKHCCASANKIDTTEELETSRFLSVLDELKDFGIQEIYFSGGEPFSRKDMLTILTKARDNDITCNISTNGSYITEEIAKQLNLLHMNKIHISLDSHLEKDFNEFRGGNYFTPTIKAIQLLKKHNLYVRVGAVIWKNNLNQLEDMLHYLISLGVDEVVFNWLVKVGRLIENKNVCVDTCYFDKTVAEIQKYMDLYQNQIKISMHRHSSFENSKDVCPAGETFFYINPKGYISPCSWIKKMDKQYTSHQTLKDTAFSEIIHCKEIQNFNKMKYKRMESCKTGCPAICLERNHTYFSEDPLLENSEPKTLIQKKVLAGVK